MQHTLREAVVRLTLCCCVRSTFLLSNTKHEVGGANSNKVTLPEMGCRGRGRGKGRNGATPDPVPCLALGVWQRRAGGGGGATSSPGPPARGKRQALCPRPRPPCGQGSSGSTGRVAGAGLGREQQSGSSRQPGRSAHQAPAAPTRYSPHPHSSCHGFDIRWIIR
jgi:hypothetical protein